MAASDRNQSRRSSAAPSPGRRADGADRGRSGGERRGGPGQRSGSGSTGGGSGGARRTGRDASSGRDAGRSGGSTGRKPGSSSRGGSDEDRRGGGGSSRGGRPGSSKGGADSGRRGRDGEDRRRSPADGRGSTSDRGASGHEAEPGPKRWGSLARRGANKLSEEGIDARGNVGGEHRGGARQDFVPERFERVDDEVRSTAQGAVGRGRKSAPRRRPRPPGPGSAGAEARDELIKALGEPKGTRAADRLREAGRAFERDRFDEARTTLRPIAEQAPGVASVRELYGLTLYRLGRWKDAVRELEAFRTLTRSTEQHPVLADSYRALKRWSMVDELWEELREASPSPELVSEGRIVVAGALADRGRLAEAISLLQQSPAPRQKVQVRHLREAYVLADLYERSGDVARARELFRFVSSEEPDFADAAERAAGLG